MKLIPGIFDASSQFLVPTSPRGQGAKACEAKPQRFAHFVVVSYLSFGWTKMSVKYANVGSLKNERNNMANKLAKHAKQYAKNIISSMSFMKRPIPNLL